MTDHWAILFSGPGVWICPSNSGNPKQYTGCPNGMDCTFLHEHNVEGCVDIMDHDKKLEVESKMNTILEKVLQ